MTDSTTFRLTLDMEDAGEEEMATLTRQLRSELLDLDVDDVEYTSEMAPEGSKSLGAVDWGQLIITLGGAGGLLTGLVGVLNSWVRRHKGSSIHVQIGEKSLKIDNTAVQDEQIEQLIRAFGSAVSVGKEQTTAITPRKETLPVVQESEPDEPTKALPEEATKESNRE